MPSKGLGLRQTKGTFQISGIVTGTEKDRFYQERESRAGNPMRFLNFGIEYDDGRILYVDLQGFTRDKVYYYKAGGKGQKGESKAVDWDNRLDSPGEGFRLIGVNVGTKRYVDANGRERNANKMMTEFDAAKELAETLQDGMSVFVRGNVSFSHYTDGNGTLRRNVRYNPTQVSLVGRPIEFTKNYEPTHAFTQEIVYRGVEPETDTEGKKTSRFVVTANIINYNTVEDATFIIENKGLANMFHKKLKPYNTINVWGHMTSQTPTETVEVEDDDDIWGEANTMERVSAPTIREMIITGADPHSIDTEELSEGAVEKALEEMKSTETANKDFGESSNDDNWGDDFDDDGDWDDIVDL